MRWTAVGLCWLALVASCAGKRPTAVRSSDDGSKTRAAGSKLQMAPAKAGTPSAFFQDFQRVALMGDADAMWLMLTDGSHSHMAQIFASLGEMDQPSRQQAATSMGLTLAELDAMSPEALVKAMLARGMKEDHDDIAGTRLVRVEQPIAAYAILHTVKPNGETEAIALVFEKGAWKLDLIETERLEDERKAKQADDATPVMPPG